MAPRKLSELMLLQLAHLQLFNPKKINQTKKLVNKRNVTANSKDGGSLASKAGTMGMKVVDIMGIMAIMKAEGNAKNGENLK
jgi:hypothetical protein